MKIACEIYCRPCGYFRPVSQFNKGKQAEFRDRKYFVYPEEKEKVEYEKK